jgi:hypothetical protein
MDARKIKTHEMSDRRHWVYFLFKSVHDGDDDGRGTNGWGFLRAFDTLSVLDADIAKFGFDELPQTTPEQNAERSALLRFLLTIDNPSRHTLAALDADEDGLDGEPFISNPGLVELIRLRSSVDETNRIVRAIKDCGTDDAAAITAVLDSPTATLSEDAL